MQPQAAKAEAERALAESWRGPLIELCDRLRREARTAVRTALERGSLTELARPIAQGVGDVSFGLDAAVERAVAAWLEQTARRGPLSLLTEETGWQHRGPGPTGTRELPGFDHGGPRIAIDPIDGTRHLMADLRSAWTIVSFAGAGETQPRFSELGYGIASEIPDSRAAQWRRLEGTLGGPARTALLALSDERLLSESELRTDAEARADHGYYLFFSYHPAMRPHVAALASRFFTRLAEHEGADLSHCYDDQYISSGGQLALLALGTYRMVVEARGVLARYHRTTTQFAKPYDMAGAALVARLAGCVVEAPEGAPLEFPIDATTPIDFVAFANRASAERLRPHLHAALAAERASLPRREGA